MSLLYMDLTKHELTDYANVILSGEDVKKLNPHEQNTLDQLINDEVFFQALENHFSDNLKFFLSDFLDFISTWLDENFYSNKDQKYMQEQSKFFNTIICKYILWYAENSEVVLLNSL